MVTKEELGLAIALLQQKTLSALIIPETLFRINEFLDEDWDANHKTKYPDFEFNSLDITILALPWLYHIYETMTDKNFSNSGYGNYPRDGILSMIWGNLGVYGLDAEIKDITLKTYGDFNFSNERNLEESLQKYCNALVHMIRTQYSMYTGYDVKKHVEYMISRGSKVIDCCDASWKYMEEANLEISDLNSWLNADFGGWYNQIKPIAMKIMNSD